MASTVQTCTLTEPSGRAQRQGNGTSTSIGGALPPISIATMSGIASSQNNYPNMVQP